MVLPMAVLRALSAATRRERSASRSARSRWMSSLLVTLEGEGGLSVDGEGGALEILIDCVRWLEGGDGKGMGRKYIHKYIHTGGNTM